MIGITDNAIIGTADTTPKPLVVGSNLSAATRIGLLSDSLEELPFRQLLVMLLDEDMKRKLMLRQLTNQDLFANYDSELILRHRSAKGLYEDLRIRIAVDIANPEQGGSLKK